jgi:hypothetical protein
MAGRGTNTWREALPAIDAYAPVTQAGRLTFELLFNEFHDAHQDFDWDSDLTPM